MTETTTAERSRYSIRKAIHKLKSEISISDYLEYRGVEVNRNRAHCVVHDGENPTAFSIDPERNRWQCFSCGEYGDLIDLCEMVEKHANTWTAVVSLARAFGVELPPRPERWYEWQGEKAKRRNALRTALAKSYRRRYFQAFFGEYLGTVEPALREEEARQLWDDLWPIAWACAGERVNRG